MNSPRIDHDCVGLVGSLPQISAGLVAHDCGYPLSRYTCRATRVALHVSQLISWILERFAGVAPVSRYTPKNFGVAPSPPPCAGKCRTEIWV